MPNVVNAGPFLLFPALPGHDAAVCKLELSLALRARDKMPLLLMCNEHAAGSVFGLLPKAFEVTVQLECIKVKNPDTSANVFPPVGLLEPASLSPAPRSTASF